MGFVTVVYLRSVQRKWLSRALGSAQREAHRACITLPGPKTKKISVQGRGEAHRALMSKTVTLHELPVTCRWTACMVVPQYTAQHPQLVEHLTLDLRRLQVPGGQRLHASGTWLRLGCGDDLLLVTSRVLQGGEDVLDRALEEALGGVVHGLQLWQLRRLLGCLLLGRLLQASVCQGGRCGEEDEGTENQVRSLRSHAAHSSASACS